MIQGVTAIRDAYRDDVVAERYVEERFRQPLGALLHSRQVDAVRRVAGQPGVNHVLEIAPGPARVTVDVAPFLRRPPVIIDASAQMLAQARRRLAAVGHGAQMIEGDAFSLPFAAKFDLVYTFRLIRHFQAGERARLYTQIARVLKPGGLFVFDAVNVVVSQRLRAHAKPGEYQHYDALLSRAELIGELEAAGFRHVSLAGVQHRYGMMQRLQYLVAPRSQTIARAAMEVADRTGGEPLEWIVTCQRG